MQNDYLKIHIIDIENYIKNINTNIFTTCTHFTKAAYFRFFIPEILIEYDRAIYLDCDLVVNHDLKELFNTNIHERPLAAVIDLWIKLNTCNNNTTQQIYLTNTLKMKNFEKYFNSGVLLLDLKKLRKINFTQKCINRLKEIKNPRYVDQCILNSLIDGNFHELDFKWNLQCNIVYDIQDIDKKLPITLLSKLNAIKNNPYIIHYCSGRKPWSYMGRDHYNIWWMYARETTFYEIILYKNIKNFPN